MNYFRNLVGTGLLLTLSVSANGDEESARPQLNSERIEQRFGSYGVHIVRQSPALRATCLYSGAGEERTCRTLALVRFVPDPDPSLATSLGYIREGASLGATLVDAGWRVEKTPGVVGQLTSADPGHAELRRFLGLRVTAPLAFHIYALRAARDDRRLQVAELLEVHHPDYLTYSELRRVYGFDGGSPETTELAQRNARIDEWLADMQTAFSGDVPFN